MNLETIQSKLPDIEQMRSASAENEAFIMRWQGRNRTASEEAPASSLSFRFLLAVLILSFLIYADEKELPNTGQLLSKFQSAVSYNIKTEDMEKLEDIWYTISDNIRNKIPDRKEMKKDNENEE